MPKRTWFVGSNSEFVTFRLASSEPRAWVVIKGDAEPLVVEMSQERPSHWSATALLTSGEYRCRFYCGDDRSVVYHGPASTDGTAEAGMDALVTVGICEIQ